MKTIRIRREHVADQRAKRQEALKTAGRGTKPEPKVLTRKQLERDLRTNQSNFIHY